MKYDFENVPQRKEQASRKWHNMLSCGIPLPDDIVPLSTADMEFKNPPEITKGLQQYLNDLILGYAYPEDSFKNALISWMARRHSYHVKPDSILNTPGVVTALFAAVKTLSKEKDGIVIMPPVYGPFFMAVERTGRELITCPLINNGNYWTMDFAGLSKIFKIKKPKALLLCSPHNPIGRVWKREELEELARLCVLHDVFIIADEIHHDLVMPGHKHTVFETVNKQAGEKCITCTSLSKTFNLAGMGLSSIIVKNEQLRSKFQTELDRVPLGVHSALAYKAAEIAYNQCESWLDEVISVIEENAAMCCSFISANISSLKTVKLEGTYLLWIDFRNLNKTNEELEHFLQEKAYLFLTQGYAFGEAGSGFARLNLAAPRLTIQNALLRLEKAVSSELE